MKKIYLSVFGLCILAASFGQTDTSKIEQYCQVIATPKILSNKVTIDIDFGEQKNFWKEDRLKTSAGKVKEFNTIIDAMNYMGKEGWSFINAFPVNLGNTEIFHFAFKKLIAKADLQKN